MPRSRPSSSRRVNSSSLQWKQRSGSLRDVVGIVEFPGGDVLVRDAEARHEGFGVALVRFGNGRRVGGHGERIAAQHVVRGPGEVRRIGAAGERHDDALQLPEIGEELFLLGVDATVSRLHSTEGAPIGNARLTS